MKAIILSAGQGRRLLPHTQNQPKCMVEVAPGITMLDWQLRQLDAAGIHDIVIVTGFRAEKIEAHIRAYPHMRIKTQYNPFFELADNLGSVWLTMGDMDRDFILINGDTMFTSHVARQLSERPEAAITLTIARKQGYDDDDMKVVEHQGRVRAIGKQLEGDDVNAESIGMIRFTTAGAALFARAVDTAMREEIGLRQYYLAVLHDLAAGDVVGVHEIDQSSWCEIDFPDDLEAAGTKIRGWIHAEEESEDSSAGAA